MAEKDQTQGAEEDTQRVDYALWEAPEWVVQGAVPGTVAGDAPADVAATSLRVVYSLQLFHEIDFVVNEGYRKVPHGGIETAGLLFGSASATEVRIEAFRPIECEHAAGPSLNFSDSDLSALEVQLHAAGQDRSLENLQPIGWFLGHTRGPLELTEAEAKHFDRFFPEPFKVTVLVKPERFQATRFGFLVRKPGGEMPRDALASAVILPLPGRSFKPGQLVPSIPAPNPIAVKRAAQPAAADEPASESRAASERVSDDVSDRRRQRRSRSRPAPSERKADERQLESIWKTAPDHEAERGPSPRIEGSPDSPPPANREERRKLARDRARLIEEAYPRPASPPAAAPHPGSPHPGPPPAESPSALGGAMSTEVAPFRPAAMPSLPMDLVRYVPSAYDRFPSGYENDPAAGKFMLNARSVTALALAALLGCLVGYIGYLQLPSPVIPIDVRPVDQTIIVSWPPEDTRNAVYAAIRLNDGVAVPLSAQEKRTGRVALSATRDFKVEIVARNWIRDSRGIVRYLHSNNGNALAIPSDAPPSP